MADRDTFLDTFKARVKLASEAWRAQFAAEVADLEFEAGDHWSRDDKRLRGDRPTLTIDLLSGPIKQVTNQQRSARPGIKISPVGKGADVEQAERWQGVVRRVERLSGAHRAYCWAGQHQAKMGRGVWVIRNVEVGDDGEQDIRIEEVENQHTVLIDPTTKLLDGSDKKWAIRFEDLTREDYIARFGETKLAQTLSAGLSIGAGDTPPDWVTSTHVRIAEYYYLDAKTRVRLILSDGQRVWEDELPQVKGRDKGRFAMLPQLPEGVTVVRKVKKVKHTVHWCLVNGAGEKLESTTIPGEFIPVVMVYGERRMIDGKRDFRGLVRMAKDPSRMEDFCESSLMEAISHAKTAPWIAEFDQIAEFQSMWNTANTAPPPVLYYKATSVDGHPIPPPTRISSNVDVSALTLAAQRMQNHVRNVTGTADVYQEETGSERGKLSGRAIQMRRMNQELGTSDYMENLGDGIALTAKIIMSMARDGVYDTPRLMRIIGADEKESEIVTYAGEAQASVAQQMLQAQQDVAGMLDVSVGEYDITVSAGRSHATARQEAVEAISQLPPEVVQVGADIYVGNMDFPGATEFAKRLKKANPLAQDDEKNQPIPPQIQQRLQQLDTFAQQATETINELQRSIEAKSEELASKERIEAAKIAAELEIKKLEIQRDLMLAEYELKKAAAQAEFDAQQAAIAGERDDQARREGFAHQRASAAENAERDEERAAREASMRNGA